ncbi:hypothetical protein M085_1001, partial [Bacteroides fragilis str. 3986 N(B)19]
NLTMLIKAEGYWFSLHKEQSFCRQITCSLHLQDLF